MLAPGDAESMEIIPVELNRYKLIDVGYVSRYD
jgi:hypothetical protein